MSNFKVKLNRFWPAWCVAFALGGGVAGAVAAFAFREWALQRNSPPWLWKVAVTVWLPLPMATGVLGGCIGVAISCLSLLTFARLAVIPLCLLVAGAGSGWPLFILYDSVLGLHWIPELVWMAVGVTYFGLVGAVAAAVRLEKSAVPRRAVVSCIFIGLAAGLVGWFVRGWF